MKFGLYINQKQINTDEELLPERRKADKLTSFLNSTKGNIIAVQILHFPIGRHITTLHKSGTATSVLFFWCLVYVSSTSSHEFHPSVLKLPSLSLFIQDVI